MPAVTLASKFTDGQAMGGRCGVLREIGGAWALGRSGTQVTGMSGHTFPSPGGPSIATEHAASWKCTECESELPDCESVPIVS